MEEKELLEKARSGDRQSLESLLYDNYKIVYGFLIKLTLNEDAARDFTQEVMVKAITHIKSFSGSSKFSTWLVSIASNAYKDSLRKNKIFSNTDFESIEMEAPDNVEERVLEMDDMSRLKKALISIPQEKRQTFILKHFYSYSYEDIAKIQRCPIGTVRSRLHYCIKKLQEML